MLNGENTDCSYHNMFLYNDILQIYLSNYQIIIIIIEAGLNRAAGILYLRFEEKFNEPAAITAWVTSLSVSLTLAVGKLRYGYSIPSHIDSLISISVLCWVFYTHFDSVMSDILYYKFTHVFVILHCR